MKLFKRRSHRPSPPLPQEKSHVGLAFGQENAATGLNTGRRLRLPAGTLDLNAALTANNNVPANFFGILSLTLNDAPNYLTSSGAVSEIIAAQPTSLTTASSNTAAATGGAEGYLAYYGPGTSTANAHTIQIQRKTSGYAWWVGSTVNWPKVTPGKKYVVWWGQLQNGGQQFLCVVDASTGQHVTNSPCYSGASNAAAVGFWYSVFTSSSNNHVRTGTGDFFSDLGSTFVTSGPAAFSGTVNELAWIYGDLSLNGGASVDANTVTAFSAGKLSVQQLARMSGMSLKSYFRFNNLTSGSVTPDTISPITGSATVNVLTGSVSDVVLGGHARAANDPIGITFNDPGAGYVHRVTPGLSGTSATGTISISGTYLGRLPPSLQARLEDGSGNPITGSDWRSIARSARQGAWKGKFQRVPVGGPYFVRVRCSNRPEVTVRSANPQYVGLVVGIAGQSQLDYQWQYIQAGSSLAIGSEIASALGIQALNYALSDVGPVPPYQMNGQSGHTALTPLTARNCPGTGVGSASLNAVGDGMLALIKTLSTLTGGWPIMIVRLTKSGHAIDTWIADRNATSYAVTISGTTYSANLATPAPGVSGSSGYDWPNGQGSSLVESVKRGSLKITGTGVMLTDDGNGNVTGTGGSGTISYGVGTTSTWTPPSISLTGLPSNVALTIAFTSMQDTQGAQELTKTAPNEFTSTGDGLTATSGVLTGVALRLAGPLSVIHWDQGSGNIGEFSASVYARGKTSYTNKLGLLIAKYKTMGVMDSQTVFVMGSHFRECTSLSGTGYDSIGGLRRAHIEIANSNSLGILPGGDYYDMDMYIAGALTGHPSNQPAGAQRMGEREAYSIWAAQIGDQTKIIGPTISGVTFVDGKNIDVTFTMPAGTSLTTNAGMTSSAGAGPSGTGTSTDGGLTFKYVCAISTYATGVAAALGAYTTVANTAITSGLNLFLCSHAITTTTTSPGTQTGVTITDGSGAWSFQGFVQPFSNNKLLAPSMFVSNGGNIYQVTAVNAAVATVAGFRVTGAATADRCDGTGFDGTTGTTDSLRFGATITAGNKVRITRTDAGSWTQGSITLDYAWGNPTCTGYTIDKAVVDQPNVGQLLYDNRFGGSSPYGAVPGMLVRPTTTPMTL